MRIVDIHERSIAISRYGDPAIPSGGLTTSMVAIVTDVVREGRPVTGYGFGSIGRFAQGGLIRERFAPRLLAAADGALADADGANLDPFRAWAVMMAGEKPGGHGERCVAVGALDMAIWDAAAKIAGLPLYRFLARRLGRGEALPDRVPVYAGGGYAYPRDDLACLADEMRRLVDLGYTRAKIKIGGAALTQDLKRVEAAAAVLGGGATLAVDAMNSHSPEAGLAAAAALAPFDLWWFEDICDPLDFPAQAAIAAAYPGPIAAGEALFSAAEARLLALYGGLRPQRDVLLFDPAHCYGLPGYLKVIDQMLAAGWPRQAFWPHGGHLFTQHVVAALGLGGAEVNPLCFQPFGGLADDAPVADGLAPLPQRPGIGFEGRETLYRMVRSLH